MDKKNASYLLSGSGLPLPAGAGEMWRLVGLGAATYFSYWQVLFAVQRALAPPDSGGRAGPPPSG